MLPQAINFSKIFAEKILFPESIQYQILRDLSETDYKNYKSKMLKENVSVKFDSLIDAFIIKPLKENSSARPWEDSTDLHRFMSKDSFRGTSDAYNIESPEYKEGFQAGIKGLKYENPYKSVIFDAENQQSKDWLHGYQDARFDEDENLDENRNPFEGDRMFGQQDGMTDEVDEIEKNKAKNSNKKEIKKTKSINSPFGDELEESLNSVDFYNNEPADVIDNQYEDDTWKTNNQDCDEDDFDLINDEDEIESDYKKDMNNILQTDSDNTEMDYEERQNFLSEDGSNSFAVGEKVTYDKKDGTKKKTKIVRKLDKDHSFIALGNTGLTKLVSNKNLSKGWIDESIMNKLSKSTKQKVKLAESKFGRAIGKFTDYVSKVVSVLKRNNVNENDDLDLETIVRCFTQGINARECARTWLSIHQARKQNESKMNRKKIFEDIFDDDWGQQPGDTYYDNKQSGEFERAARILRKISKIVDKIPEEEYQEAFEKLERIYDKYLVEKIESLINLSSYNITEHELLNLGIEISNRYGTEPKQVLNAIDDLKDSFSDYLEEEQTYRPYSVETDEEERRNKKTESYETKKTLIMEDEKEMLFDDNDEDIEDEENDIESEDFDSDINSMLLSLKGDEDDEEDTEEDDVDVADDGDEEEIKISEIPVDNEIDDIETIINRVLDSRKNTKFQYDNIPSGQINSSLNDFGVNNDDIVSCGCDVDDDRVLASEFQDNQDRIGIVKSKIDNSISYEDFLEGNITNEEPGEIMIDDDDFKRNAELSNDEINDIEDGDIEVTHDDYDDGDEDEEQLLLDDESEEEQEVDDINKTVSTAGMPIKIVLTGMVLENSEIKFIANEARRKGIKVKKIISEENKKIGIFVESNNKKYKVCYEDVAAIRNKMPYSINKEKFQSLDEAFAKIKSESNKLINERNNFKKFVTNDVLKKDEARKQIIETDILKNFKDAKNTKCWNVKSIGNVSLKTGINEVLSNITGFAEKNNTLIKTENKYFLIKGSLNERSLPGTKCQLFNLKEKKEYGTGEVIGIYPNNLEGLGKIMERIKSNNIPLLIWS